jgi:hypothetical protein
MDFGHYTLIFISFNPYLFWLSNDHEIPDQKDPDLLMMEHFVQDEPVAVNLYQGNVGRKRLQLTTRSLILSLI